jgi:anti-anti-sigma factor
MEGVLDRSSVPDIRQKLLKLARMKRVKNLELDFVGITSIDTAGVALLVELMRHLSRKDGKLELKGANEQVRQMIRLARVDSIFEMTGPTDGEMKR